MADRRVLGVFAHPDDETFRCGGTLALLSRQGVEVHILTATRGGAGSCGDPPRCSREELPAMREQELRCACDALGIAPPHLLDYADGCLSEATEKLMEVVLEKVCHLRPEVILSFGPDGLSGHPDHITIGRCAMEAFDQIEHIAALYTLALPHSAAEQFDDLTGLYSLRARYYDPALGRFLSRDAAAVLYGNPRELNRYGYVANNPINRLDPSGRAFLEVGEIELNSAVVASAEAAIARGIWVAYGWPLIRTLLIGGAALGGNAVFQQLPYLIPQPIPAPSPGPAPQPLPEPEPVPIPPIDPVRPRERDDYYCNPETFTAWWFTLTEQPQGMTANWYDYENRVARASGRYGIHPRDVGYVFADGIEPFVCDLVDAKYIDDPANSIYNINHLNELPAPLRDDFMFQLFEEFVGYKSSIYLGLTQLGKNTLDSAHEPTQVR